MRNILLIIIIFFSGKNIAQWTITPSPTTNKLNSVHFATGNVGYAVGDNGSVLKTVNQGNSWAALTTTVAGTCLSVHCSNSDTLFVGSSNGRVYETIDGGNSWYSQNPNLATAGAPSTVTSVFSFSSNFVYAVGYVYVYNQSWNSWVYSEMAIKKQTNSPQNFVLTPASAPSSGIWGNKMRSVFFLDTLVGYNCVNNKISKTTDGGQSWTSTISSNLHKYNSIFFANHNVGYIAGENGIILKTTDAGTNWQVLYSGVNVSLNSIHFVTPDSGCVVGVNGTILGTIDGGITWINQSPGITDNLNSVFFTDLNTGYAVGDNGIILKTTHSPVGIKKTDQNKNDVLVFPNPSTGIVTINTSVSKGVLYLYDLEGKEMKKQQFNSRSFNLDLGGLSSGSYIIKIVTDKNVFTHKITKE